MKSIEWICELEGCNNIFLRFPYQVKKGEKRYCSQSHSSLGSTRSLRVPKLYDCKWCQKETQNYSKICNKCKKVLGSFIRNDIDYKSPLIYYRLLEIQDNKCAICNSKVGSTKHKNLSIDHDHKTGKIRGLLCTSCNRQLGWYENKKELVEKYLQNNPSALA